MISSCKMLPSLPPGSGVVYTIICIDMCRHGYSFSNVLIVCISFQHKWDVFLEYTTLIVLKCLAFVPKGEEYKLQWPEQSEFVRMAARFGAKIIPFGAVGEDDISEVS